MRARVAVGMSGGVDSTVSAWLLKQKGYDVAGVYMVNWDPQEEGTSKCSRTKDEADARRACNQLGIPLHVVNFVKEYWNKVFLDLIDNYKRGRTVVPDIRCNQSIKFQHLHQFAIEKLNVDYVATGHYASTSFGDFQEKRSPFEKIRLLSGSDPLKDQTYFLCTLNQSQLKRAMFPVGSLVKKEVKKIAEEQGFADIAQKPESMGICFVGKRKNFEEFLDQYIEEKRGRLITTDGKFIGEHRGIHHFTLGKKIRLLSNAHLGYYVAHIDTDTNDIIVCEGSNHPSLYAKEFVIQEPVWIADIPEENDTQLEFRIQRTHPTIPCRISRLSGGLMLVTSAIPIRAAASGQMCIFYHGNECLGGGEVEYVTKPLAYGSRS